jgi:glycosyltransferase involved in cell wall biosynthesis
MNVPGSGVLSLVRSGKNGFLVKPSRPGQIAQRVIELLQDEKKRKGMGMRGRKFVEKYDWEIIANRTLKVYQEVA